MDYPSQISRTLPTQSWPADPKFDCRDYLHPRRVTVIMWDQGYLVRHLPGESFADYNQVLDETIERGYNTVRIDPLPNLIHLDHPETIFAWADPQRPFMPWANTKECSGPAGLWLIDFMQKVLQKNLFYTLSTWWFDETNWCGLGGVSPKVDRIPRNHREAAEIWIPFLHRWKKEFGFANLLYVDLHNEVPFFMNGYKQMLKEKLNLDWDQGLPFTAEQSDFLSDDLNSALKMAQREFPELRFTASIHGDERWLSVPLNFDCLDVHFYLDADSRWTSRSRFNEFISQGIYRRDDWFKEFSDRCNKTHRAVMPMLFQRQQQRLAAFSAWADRFGTPLTTSESWASWFYLDHPDLDWQWLLEWAAMSVDGAIRHRMWGWTPHNYAQPHFANWRDVEWHRKLTDKFLHS